MPDPTIHNVGVDYCVSHDGLRNEGADTCEWAHKNDCSCDLRPLVWIDDLARICLTADQGKAHPEPMTDHPETITCEGCGTTTTDPDRWDPHYLTGTILCDPCWYESTHRPTDSQVGFQRQ